MISHKIEIPIENVKVISSYHTKYYNKFDEGIMIISQSIENNIEVSLDFLYTLKPILYTLGQL